MANTLLFMLKRAIRERAKSIRISSVAYLFKLLDKLSTTKNKSAPLIYKTLIFSLIENPNDPTIREMYFANFKDLYQSNPSIPVGLLADPLVKQIQTSLGVSFQLKIFDFDFFIYIIDHPKLQLPLGLEIFDLFTNVALKDLSYSNAAQECVLSVLSRFLVARPPARD